MTQDRVCRLVKYHEIHLRSENGAPDLSRSFLLRLLNQFGEEDLRTLFRMHRADRIATGYSSTDRENERLRERMSALDALLAEKPCFSIKDLAVNGSDLLALGLQGKAIGLTLQRLLEEVMAGSTENNREALLERVSSEMDKVRSI